MRIDIPREERAIASLKEAGHRTNRIASASANQGATSATTVIALPLPQTSDRLDEGTNVV